MNVIDNIPLELPEAELLDRPGLEAMLAAGEVDLPGLLAEARELGHPRACYRLAEIEGRGEGAVRIAGRRFESRILSINLEEVGRVGLYVATCGRELQRWAESRADFLEQYLADQICEQALREALHPLERELDQLLPPGHPASMNPGSLEDWPLTQQPELFAALGDVAGAIGVELTESCLMLPRKSVSGVRFSAAEEYVNCRYCPRGECLGRRAPFDQAGFERRYPGARSGNLYPVVCERGGGHG